MNLDDVRDLIDRLTRRPAAAAKVLRRITGGREKRTQAAWAYTVDPPRNWSDIPAVRARWNTLVSGDPGVDWRQHIARTHLAGASSLVGLSLGCGNGFNEVAWAKSGLFRRLDAYDLSPVRLDHAVALAGTNGVAEVIRFQQADVFRVEAPPSSYDVIMTEGSLHHFAPLSVILERIAGWLKPEGHFVINEYVGPSRFQWTKRQVAACNGLLALLPEEYRRRWGTDRIKTRVLRPSRLRMLVRDPSEAVQSADILPLLERLFEVVELRGFGGTILHLTLYEIAHNFVAEVEAARRWLQLCFDVENRLLADGGLTSDFVVAVCRRRR